MTRRQLIRAMCGSMTLTMLTLKVKPAAHAHPHRPEENVPPHIHEVTGRRTHAPAWMGPAFVVGMLIASVGVPYLIYLAGARIARSFRDNSGTT